MKWLIKAFGNKKLSAPSDAAAEKLRSQKSEVKSVSAWLERRQFQNGFGEDFEYTLRPRGAK